MVWAGADHLGMAGYLKIKSTHHRHTCLADPICQQCYSYVAGLFQH
jgi:hypothetical protein